MTDRAVWVRLSCRHDRLGVTIREHSGRLIVITSQGIARERGVKPGWVLKLSACSPGRVRVLRDKADDPRYPKDYYFDWVDGISDRFRLDSPHRCLEGGDDRMVFVRVMCRVQVGGAAGRGEHRGEPVCGLGFRWMWDDILPLVGHRRLQPLPRRHRNWQPDLRKGPAPMTWTSVDLNFRAGDVIVAINNRILPCGGGMEIAEWWRQLPDDPRPATRLLVWRFYHPELERCCSRINGVYVDDRALLGLSDIPPLEERHRYYPRPWEIWPRTDDRSSRRDRYDALFVDRRHEGEPTRAAYVTVTRVEHHSSDGTTEGRSSTLTFSSGLTLTYPNRDVYAFCDDSVNGEHLPDYWSDVANRFRF